VVKHINVAFDDATHERLNEVKGENRTWGEAIIEEFEVDADE